MTAVTRPPLTRPKELFDGDARNFDGTVNFGESALPGAAERTRQLRAADEPGVFVTGKPLETATKCADALTRLRIRSQESEVITAVRAPVHQLRTNHFGSVVLSGVAAASELATGSTRSRPCHRKPEPVVAQIGSRRPSRAGISTTEY